MQRRLEPALGQHRRVDAAGELAQLGEARPQLRLGAVEQAGELLVLLDPPARGAQQQRERDEPRLRAVVQVALSRRRAASPASTSRAREARSSSMRSASSASRCETWLRSRPPRNANGISPVAMNAAQNAMSPAPAPRDGDEQERHQRADVDRRELQPLERAGGAPALHARRSTTTNSTK